MKYEEYEDDFENDGMTRYEQECVAVESKIPQIEQTAYERDQQGRNGHVKKSMIFTPSLKDKRYKMKGGVSEQERVKIEENDILSEERKTDGAKEKPYKESRGKAYNIALELEERYSFAIIDDQLYKYEECLGYWKLIQESEANRDIRKLISDEWCQVINKSVLAEIYEWLLIKSPKNKGYSDRKHFLNFQNCAIDWRNKEIVEKRQQLYFKYTIQMPYEKKHQKSTKRFQKFVQDVFGEDEDTIREFKKFLGLCLSDIRYLKLCFFLYGPSNSGKSVFLNVLKRIVGTDWTSSLSFTQMGNEFAITQLLGKRLNVSGEVSGASNKRLDIFKTLTGNDNVTACFKGRDHFQFTSECLLVFACNNFPPIQALDEFESFLSRIIIFPFSNVIPREKWVDNLDAELAEDQKTIIEYAIEGLQQLEKDNYRFVETDAMRECRQEFIGMYNSFELFAEKCIERDIEETLSSAQIRNRYIEYCKENDYVMLPDNVWTQLLKQKYNCRQKMITVKDDFGKTRIRAYQGIRLKDEMGKEVDWNAE